MRKFPTSPRLRSTTLLLAVSMAIGSIAHAADTVQIGGETKFASGLVTGVEAGDVACYLTLEDADGESFTEMAAFEICEQQEQLVGHQVALSYAMENVLAAECQGDVDCGKSDRVALVTSAKLLDGAAAPAADADAETDATPGAAPESFCTARETVVFACRSGAKLVSVCASADASARSGYLQYRFGKPGAGAIELTLPKDARLPPASATGENAGFSGGGGSWLRFANGSHSYVVYSGIGRWGEDGQTVEKEGVRVESKSKTVAELACSGAVTSELGPEWFERIGIGANDEEFLFAE